MSHRDRGISLKKTLMRTQHASVGKCVWEKKSKPV